MVRTYFNVLMGLQERGCGGQRAELEITPKLTLVPSLPEYLQICRAVAIGFAIMGGIGYVVKLIHIPINHVLVGGA